MSRIGKKIIAIAGGVKISQKNGIVFVEGPKGKLSAAIPQSIQVDIKDGHVHVSRSDDSIKGRSLHGTTRSLILNMIRGVSAGFQKNLFIEGVGFKAALQGKNLNLSLGFTHPINLKVPEGITVKISTPTDILLEGPDKREVGQFAANIRANYEPEPYKGKGVRYSTEHVRRKAGKTVTK